MRTNKKDRFLWKRNLGKKTNKKALLLGEHVVNIIIAVLCILVLIYLGFQVYNLYLGAKQEKEEAKYTLEMVIGALAELKDEGQRICKPVVNPKEWVLMTVNEKLCICPAPSLSSYVTPERKLVEGACLKKGVCKDVDKNLKIYSSCHWGRYLAEGVINCLEIEPMDICLIKQKYYIEISTGSAEKNILSNILKSSVEVNGEIKTFEDFIFMAISDRSYDKLLLEKGKEVLNKFCDEGYVFEVTDGTNNKEIGFEKNSLFVNYGLGPTIGGSMEPNYQQPIELETSRNDKYYVIKYRPHKEC